LKLLREKETELVKRGGKMLDQDILEIQNEMQDLEEQIRVGCVNQIQSVSAVIDAGLQVVARLDVVFAKAAFGLRLNGRFPEVAKNGRIDVGNFVHPVLLMRDLEGSFPGVNSLSLSNVVPINLHLSSDQGDQALIISGPNGGGKTVAMKSFGIVCILCKLGIPIPVSSPTGKSPRVDFFDNILVEAGDQQSVIEGESTWMAKVNAYASILRLVMNSAESSQTSLVILDELGGSTDPDAGSAVSQAVLEHLLAGDKCRVVATTHLPRLKALSYESPIFGCATVLLQRSDSSEYQVPTFQLEYGLIGESYALGTVSRSIPSMPETVLSRAVELMVSTGEDPTSDSGNRSREANYISALTSSMEEQLHRANKARSASERSERDSVRCRSALLSLAAAYDNQLAMLERRVEDCYQALRTQKRDEVEILGDTLAALRVVKKEIRSQQDLLRERGLRVLPVSYQLVAGETVVIVASGEWDGATAQVLANGAQDKTLSPTEVLVQPSSAFNSVNDVYPALCEPIVFQRHELAIWDYASVWEDDVIKGSTFTSVPDSRRKLSSLLSTLKTKEVTSTVERGNDKSKRADDSFRSSRARKAAVKTRKKSKK
jgi:dsDNA-specific endonuclease/ATPase MutS2